VIVARVARNHRRRSREACESDDESIALRTVSERFGKAQQVPQTETTPFWPRSPYGVAKVFSYWATVNYRESYGLCASNGILFNHESPRRGETFVTRKITRGIANIVAGKEKTLFLGNLDARRDWGYAADYVRAMWLMLQQDEPGDYVVATGATHSVRDLVRIAFERVGVDWRRVVRVDDALQRGKAELHDLVGDASKAREQLGWAPSLDFEGLVHLLVDSDLGELRAAESAA